MAPGWRVVRVCLYPGLTSGAKICRSSGAGSVTTSSFFLFLRNYLFNKSTGSRTSVTLKYFASAGYFFAVASYMA